MEDDFLPAHTDLKGDCVKTHSPVPYDIQVHHILPLEDGGKDEASNRIGLCATGHVGNLHYYYRALKRFGGADSVPWDIKKRFSLYIRGLAEEGYRRYLERSG